jgi:cytoskeletal protein RodZ
MEDKKTNSTIFEELKKIRSQKKIDLKKIAEDSRIQLDYLQAFENGDIQKIPEVYDKLFFRSYLKALEVDEEYYYKEFLKYRKRIRVDKTTTVIDIVSKSRAEHKVLNYKNFLIILPFIIVLLVLWLLVKHTEILVPEEKEAIQEIDIQSVVQEMNAIVETKQDTLEDVINDIALVINGLQKTWFRVIVDKRDTSEYLLNRGNQLNLHAKDYFEFLIGRADGLKLQLNGEDLGVLGPDSLVISYLLVDSSGIAVKRLRIPRSSKLVEDTLENNQ